MVFAGNPELLVSFRQGESAALETVYWAYADRVTRIVQALVGHWATAAGEGIRLGRAELGDLVQEVFVRAFSPGCRQRYDAARPYGPYLGQIARNVVADHWRSARRQVVVDVAPLLDALSFDADRIEKDSERWTDPETIAVVESYLASLDPETRRVHEALYVRGMSQRDAATALGLGRQAVRGIEARLRAGVRQALSRAGQLPDELPRHAPAPATARGGLR